MNNIDCNPIFIVTYPKNRKNYIGLCNLLKTMYSCSYINYSLHNKDVPCISNNIAQVYLTLFNDETKILKTNKPVTNISFDDINNHISTKNAIYCLLDWRFYLPNNILTDCSNFISNQMNHTEKKEIDLKFTNIPINIRNIYLPIIAKFKFNDNILTEVNIFTQNNKNYIGVHIRTWTTDLIGDKFPNLSPRQEYYKSIKHEFIKKINSLENKNIVICTDNKNEIQKNIIPFIENKNIIQYQYNIDLNNHQNSIIELLILSKAIYLIGSLNSTFTEMAWWYSECLVPIHII